MQLKQEKTFGLTNNQLKIIAMVTMLVDHIGEMLYPDIIILKIIGRLSFPIFAYMIAEGCYYTKNRVRYLCLIGGMGVAFQAVYYLFMQSLYMGVLITFSLSIITIYSIDKLLEGNGINKKHVWLIALILVIFISCVLPILLKEHGYRLDYTVIGVALPVVIYYSKNKWIKLISAMIVLFLLALHYGGIQYFGLLAIVPLAFYNGRRGKIKLKYAFYIFYPLHLIILYVIQMALFL